MFLFKNKTTEYQLTKEQKEHIEKTIQSLNDQMIKRAKNSIWGNYITCTNEYYGVLSLPGIFFRTAKAGFREIKSYVELKDEATPSEKLLNILQQPGGNNYGSEKFKILLQIINQPIHKPFNNGIICTSSFPGMTSSERIKILAPQIVNYAKNILLDKNSYNVDSTGNTQGENGFDTSERLSRYL